MTLFINLRASANGGIVAAEAGAWDDGTSYVSPQAFAHRVEGRDVLLATHGFNVDQQAGIKALSMWGQRCQLPDSCLFVGVLWPGDSRLHVVVDYVYEGVEAIASGKLIAGYLNQNATRAQSISFASHSLGARTVLEAVRGLDTNPRRVILMAGAIENDCLVREYADAAAKVSEIYVLASRSDFVLEWAFPAGNLIGEIIMHGHPYDRTALGRNGPVRPIPSSLHVGAWQIPDGWDYGHLDYLPKGTIGPAFALPVVAPGPDTGIPVDQSDPASAGWKPAWSAGAVATQAVCP
jgi:hypothetical protein